MWEVFGVSSCISMRTDNSSRCTDVHEVVTAVTPLSAIDNRRLDTHQIPTSVFDEVQGFIYTVFNALRHFRFFFVEYSRPGGFHRMTEASRTVKKKSISKRARWRDSGSCRVIRQKSLLVITRGHSGIRNQENRENEKRRWPDGPEIGNKFIKKFTC